MLSSNEHEISFILFDYLRPSQNKFSHAGMGFSGLNQY